LFYDDFGSGFKPEQVGSPYIFFFSKTNVSVGGVIAIVQSLIIHSTSFTYTAPNPLDHYKYVVYQKLQYNAPKRGAELIYEGILSVQQTGLTGIPASLQATNGSIIGVNNINIDIRLA